MKLALVLAAVLMGGCAFVQPDYLTAAVVHQSQPFVGKYPPPFGDSGRTPESNYDALEVGVGWQRGQWFFETTGAYAVQRRNIKGGPWITMVRGGIKVPL